MPLIAATTLGEFAAAILRAAGSEATEAHEVAGHLVDANLAGHDSHGVAMLPLYLGSVRRGGLFFNRAPALVRDSGAVLVFDGARGFGRTAARSRARRASEGIDVDEATWAQLIDSARSAGVAAPEFVLT